MRQLALCMGNNDYQSAELKKLGGAVEDAQAMAQKLKERGFEVLLEIDSDRCRMHRAVDAFEGRLPGYEVGLFYYAGHGFECRGDNLLMPIDTDGSGSGYHDWAALKLDYVLDALEGKRVHNALKVKIVVLDACRQNPGGRGASPLGFAPVLAPKGTIIGFSTSPGQTAKERGGHGLYTKALLDCIDLPRIPIENMFKHVREQLAADTHGTQISWEHTSLMGNYCFNEDRLDAGAVYRREAFCDNEYHYHRDSAVGAIVGELKSHNFYKQNPVIQEIKKLDFNRTYANDLFVLGRNIYQAADGGAWSARRFIEDLPRLAQIPDNAKGHLLNGMAYEIYFDSQGEPRLKLKTDSASYLEVLALLETEAFQGSKNFIAAQLAAVDGPVVYLPGCEEQLELRLRCHLHKREEGDVHYVDAVYFHGQNILYNHDGTAQQTAPTRHIFEVVTQPALQERLAKTLAAPPDMLRLTFEGEAGGSGLFALPFTYTLRHRPAEAPNV